ncbi:MarR family winged helix-turn-helix transcriptional regulator [Nocardia caishijiensis]|uniref:MarR family transcriptional regulator n=1 Tax=Nocardia caishijiensis TaxID=184756 RepID=A0ABQ6YJM8_9NOCA|nr:MarR family winged helix-turn-helix transcriptional regulator [Nocardia caishijiensis]KAF0845983.1 MarR family transcriptional regulator [Nocardia caishijiensis]
MTRWLSEQEQQTWQAFIRMRQRLDAALSAGLAEHGLSMADYELMVPLSAAPQGCLRARDLAAEVCWDKSRLSKQLARMAARGLIERAPAADDARGIVVTLADHGREVLRAAAPEHVELVRKLFVDNMTRQEAAALRSLADKVASAVEQR